MVTFRQVATGVLAGAGGWGVCVQWGQSFSSEDEASRRQPRPRGQQHTQGSQYTSNDDAGRY